MGQFKEAEGIEDTYKTTPLRWVILVCFILVLTTGAWVMVSFSPVSSIVADVYGVSAVIVNSCVVVFLLSFIVFNFMSVWALEIMGLKWTVSVFSWLIQSIVSN